MELVEPETRGHEEIGSLTAKPVHVPLNHNPPTDLQCNLAFKSRNDFMKIQAKPDVARLYMDTVSFGQALSAP